MHAHQNIIIFFILHEIFPNLAEKANVKNVMNLIADIRLEIKCSSGRASFSGWANERSGEGIEWCGWGGHDSSG